MSTEARPHPGPWTRKTRGSTDFPWILPHPPPTHHAGPWVWVSTPLGGRRVAGTGLAIPGTVGVPGQAAVSTGSPVSLAAVQAQVGDTHR